MESSNIRQGYVTIHRDSGGKFSFKGIDVAGRDYAAGISIQRKVVMSHKAPEWFQQLCNRFADTRFKINVRVDTLKDSKTATVIPLVDTLDEAIKDYVDRYGVSGEELVHKVLHGSFDAAIKAHEFVAEVHDLVIDENIQEGFKTRSIAHHKTKGTKCVIIGGMLVGKVVRDFEPENPLWQRAVKGFVRIHPV